MEIEVTQPRPVFRTFGFIDGTFGDLGTGGETLVDGWALSPDGLLLDQVDVFLGDQHLTVVSVDYGRKSADVAARYPDLPNSDQARFVLVVEGLEDYDPKKDLLWIQPWSAGRRGVMILRLPESGIPAIRDEDAGIVGGGGGGVGIEFLRYFIQLADLRPHEQVLDVGCGVGRQAWGLAHYLNERGRYEGFDIVESSVRIARETIGPFRSNFTFQTVDLYNHMYNPVATLEAKEFIFPYEDGAFDFLYLTSVFTHMGTPEVRNYIQQFARVLRSGGRLTLTCFLLTSEARELIAAGRSTLPIEHPRDDACFAASKCHPESAVGYLPEPLFGWFADAGFRVRDVYPGFWCGRTDYLSYQDVLILQKN